MAQTQLGKKEAKIDFTSLLYAQELVMLLAHLDAFMGDSVRAICRRQPQILRRNKTFTWETIIDAVTWEALIEKMIEEYAYDFGWMSIKKRIEFLRVKQGLSLDTPDDEIAEIDNAEKLRHIVIHNGGRVSQEHLNRTQRTDVGIGEIIPIQASYTENLSNKIRLLGSDIFIAIAIKFFRANRDDLTGIWRRSAISK